MRILLVFLLIFSNLAFANGPGPISAAGMRLHFSSEAELKEKLEPILSSDSVSKLFDEIGNTKVEIQVFNDYNFEDPNSGRLEKLNDDIGKTHGYKISIYKNIAPLVDGSDLYYVNISYESNLYTNSDQPEAFQNDYRDTLYLNEDGFWQADVFFKEENIVKLMIGKIKTADAFYYEAGVGYHEINASDANRGFILSSITQQAWLHHAVNDNMGATYREYNYLSNPAADDQGILVEGDLGYDHTLFQTPHNRTFVRAGVNARATQVKDASFVGTYIKVGHDYNPGKESFIPAVRVVGGVSHKEFKKGHYQESFFEIGTQTEYIGFKIKYVMPLTDDPSYLNALPDDFVGREFKLPAKEPTVWLQLEGRLP